MSPKEQRETSRSEDKRMRWEEFIDADEVRKAIKVLQKQNGVFEVRAIGTAKKDIMSGYFRDAETLLAAFDTIDMRNRNAYVTIGEVKEECFARSQSEIFLKSPQTTSDNEIMRYRWLFVDLDPVRTAGVSSSSSELAEAERLSGDVRSYLSGLGFADPVIALSGNGYHLLYRIDINNDEIGRPLIERCLKTLAEIFNTEKVKIDTTNSNPSRICKLHGTVAQKGRNTKDRPHRMSKILSVPDPIQITPVEILRRLVAELPEGPQIDRQQSSYQAGQQFDLLDFMHRHGMTYEEDSNDRATIYRLDECPFDASHKNGDAKIFLYRNGAIAFKCHHNSCKEYKWQDVRLKFEPNAYDHANQKENDARIDAGYKQHLAQKDSEQQANQEKKPKQKRTLRKLKPAAALMDKDLPDPKILIGVGDELPLLVEGTCILSAKPKLGKSWLALSMCLALSNGEDFLGYHTKKCSTLYLDLETSEQLQQKRLRKALMGKPVPKNFYLDTETDSLENGFVDQIEAYLKEDPDIGLIVIDVFQIIRSPAKSIKESEYDHAYRDITPLNNLAQKHHVSIILVCHDRKAVDPDDPFSNILGSTGLQGAATQMMVMFRKRKNDPIHISVKGKTIDGLPELDVKLDNAVWSIVEGVNAKDRELEELDAEYSDSLIRETVIEISKNYLEWKGRSSSIIEEAVEFGIPIEDTPKTVGGFMHRHQGRFLAKDGIKVSIIDNGTGPKIYKIEKGSRHRDEDSSFIPFEEFSKYRDVQVAFE